MLSTTATILPIIIAGLMNGSFIVPSKSIKNISNDKIWLYHSIIGLVIIPWLTLVFIGFKNFQNYLFLQPETILLITASGAIFGCGQIMFANAIRLIGVALSFAINLGIGATIGSMFVVIYKSSFFTYQGFVVAIAVLFILFSLILYYCSGKNKHFLMMFDRQQKYDYTKGWALASLTGVTSGLQNITFVLVAFHTNNHIQTTNFFWIWPPFLFAAAIPMFFFFKKKAQNNLMDQKFLSIKSLTLIFLMGLFFTGSLALYSSGMSQASHEQQIIGWPVFMISIIFTSQAWGMFFNEAKNSELKHKLYRTCSFFLLIAAIVIIATQA